MERKRKLLSSELCIVFSVMALIITIAATLPARAFGSQDGILDGDGKGGAASSFGVYFYRLEPSFYTGFAPRSQDARRIHTYVGRGNQLRVTVVLSDEMIAEYLSDVATRYLAYRELIDTGQIILSQNTGFEKFRDTVFKEDIQSLARQRETLSQKAYREISLEKMKRLNPGKIFHIRIDFEKRIAQWSDQLGGIRSRSLSPQRSLDVINDILPTRLRVSGLAEGTKGKLHTVIEAYARYEKSKQQADWNRFYDAAADLFMTVTGGIYPLREKTLDYYEFTAIYPIGTLNQYERYGDVQIPLYPAPGKRRLRIHQRTRVVDHIPDKANYSYLPWIPYMHVGKRMHNSFHSLWFNIETRKSSFIPDEWKQNTEGSRTGKPYPHLWLLSRGPMSHGCTHVNAGHISELRQLLPSSEADLGAVVTYRNKSDHFDVFDINGDGRPEVMGVKYFFAYSLKNKKPHKMRAANDRKSFYAWLYKKGYRYDEQDRVVFDGVTTSKFLGNKAVNGKTYTNIPLYEAEYSPETIQFFKYKDIRFVRELRRVSSTYQVNRSVLKLGL